MSLSINHLNNFQLEEKKILVGVSGGLDSTVLFHLFLNSKWPFAVYHVNYKLRGKESDLDENLVMELCAKNKIPVYIHRLTENWFQGGNLQHEAREIRREIAQNWMNQSENSMVVYAHHRDDQNELFFMNLFRQSGLKGLAGMNEIQNNILRPLLNYSKIELTQLAQKNKWLWREDQSNKELKYQRNLWRNKLLPAITAQNPQLPESIDFIQAIFKSELQQLSNWLQTVLDEYEIQHEITQNQWNAWTETQQHYFASNFIDESWFLKALKEFEGMKTSSEIGKSGFFKTKNGFSNFMHSTISIEDISVESISVFAPSLDKMHFDFPFELKDQFEISTLQGLDSKSAKRNIELVTKTFKDSGIPKQWRNSYPFLIHNQKIVWIPKLKIFENKPFELENRPVGRFYLRNSKILIKKML